MFLAVARTVPVLGDRLTCAHGDHGAGEQAPCGTPNQEADAAVVGAVGVMGWR